MVTNNYMHNFKRFYLIGGDPIRSKRVSSCLISAFLNSVSRFQFVKVELRIKYPEKSRISIEEYSSRNNKIKLVLNNK